MLPGSALAVIVASDHGEAIQGEMRGHGLSLHESVVRIPMWVRGPGFEPGAVSSPVSLVDLAPTADHTAGRWALALTVVGYVVGRVRPEAGQGALGVLGTVAGAAFVGGSVFALTGLLLGDSAAGVGAVLGALGISVLWDVLLTPLVLPPLLALFRRLEPAHAF